VFKGGLLYKYRRIFRDKLKDFTLPELKKNKDNLHDENLCLKRELTSSKSKVSSLKQDVLSKNTQVGFLHQEIDSLNHQLKLLKVALFGKKSEKFKDSDVEGLRDLILPNLFNEAETIVDGPEDKDENESSDSDESVEIDNKVTKKKKPGRKALPLDLEREEVIHDLTEEAKICHCGCAMSNIGEESSEQLDYIPAKLRVLVHKKLKYACRKCYENVQTARMSGSHINIIDGGTASSGLLSHSMVSKFEDHLPFYRQSQMWLRKNINISDRTLCNWMIKCSDLLEGLIPHLKADIFNSGYACSDETGLNVLLSDSSKSYMWVHHSGSRLNRSVLFDYHDSRSGKKALEFLEGFKGVHQCDGYSGYNHLYGVEIEEDENLVLRSDKNKKQKKVLISSGALRAGCMDHARRKFYDVYKTSNKKAGLAKEILTYIKKLYKTEKEIQARNLPVAEIKSLRQSASVKIFNEIKKKLLYSKDLVAQNSALSNAVNYMLNQWDALTLYLEHGEVRIANADAERIIKPFVIGRKNWLFSKTERGAKASAIIYSIVETCKANNVNSYEYLRYVLVQLKKAKTDESINIKNLLPYNIDRELIKRK
jgi:transposase